LEKRTFKIVFVVLILVGLVAGSGYGASQAVRSANEGVSKSTDAPIMVPGNFAELAEKVRNGVVNIQAVKNIKNGGRVYRQFFGNPFGRQNPFEDFFGSDFSDNSGWKVGYNKVFA